MLIRQGEGRADGGERVAAEAQRAETHGGGGGREGGREGGRQSVAETKDVWGTEAAPGEWRRVMCTGVAKGARRRSPSAVEWEGWPRPSTRSLAHQQLQPRERKKETAVHCVGQSARGAVGMP